MAIPAIPWTTTVQQVIPSGTGGASCVPGGSAWTSGAWVPLSSAMTANGYLTGIGFRGDETALNQEFEIDLGVGADPASGLLATMRGYNRTVSGICDNALYFPMPIPISGIVSGSALSARVRVSNSSVNPWTVSATWLPSPIVGNLATTAQPLKCHPSATAGLSIVHGNAYAAGTWGQLWSSLPTDIVIAGIVAGWTTGHGWVSPQIDIGIGTAPSGTVRTSVKYAGPCGGGSFPDILMFPVCYDGFKAGDSIVMRWTTSEVFPYSGESMVASILYYEKPL